MEQPIDKKQETIEQLDIIKSTNREMLNYFNSIFLSSLEDIQELKTQAFEIDIKIDELEKTKDVYAFKTSSKKSVFTPLADEGIDMERSKIIDAQIRDLFDVKDSLTSKLRGMETSMIKLKKRLAVLNDAEDAIQKLYDALEEPAPTENEDFEFVSLDVTSDKATHGYDILMLDAFDKTYLSTVLDKNLRENIENMNHKLELLSYLITTDTSRAKLSVQELLLANRKLLDSIQDINGKLDCCQNTESTIADTVTMYLKKQVKLHPKCKLEPTIECMNPTLSLHPVFTINILKLLNIFFDNIYKHSDATLITFKMSISQNVVDVSITDNGVGIKDTYMTDVPWYSSLHKAHQIIYLLGGKLEIKGDIMNGTSVRFAFSVKE